MYAIHSYCRVLDYMLVLLTGKPLLRPVGPRSRFFLWYWWNSFDHLLWLMDHHVLRKEADGICIDPIPPTPNHSSTLGVRRSRVVGFHPNPTEIDVLATGGVIRPPDPEWLQERFPSWRTFGELPVPVERKRFRWLNPLALVSLEMTHPDKRFVCLDFVPPPPRYKHLNLMPTLPLPHGDPEPEHWSVPVRSDQWLEVEPSRGLLERLWLWLTRRG